MPVVFGFAAARFDGTAHQSQLDRRTFSDFALQRHFAAKLPDVFVKYAQVADQPARLDATEIASNRDQWIADWTAAVLH